MDDCVVHESSFFVTGGDGVWDLMSSGSGRGIDFCVLKLHHTLVSTESLDSGATPMEHFLLRLLTLLAVSAFACAQESSPWHDPSRHTVQFITVDEGVQLEVLDWGGTGRPVVLLAGLGFTAHVFDGFAEKLTDSYHVYGITRRGYGASTRPASGYTEQRLADDDLRVFEALKLVAPVVVGHSVAGNELSRLGSHHFDRIGGLVYLEALNDGTDDYTDYDALCSKLPQAMQKGPTPSPADLKSFPAYRDWRKRTQRISIPESELRSDFAENPDGSVGSRKTPSWVPDAMMGDWKHDYSQIRSPVLAFVVYDTPDGPPQNQIQKYHATDAAERAIVDAVYGLYIGMARIRIERINRAAGGAHVVELWGADHFVFLSNEADVLRELRVFLATLAKVSANRPAGAGNARYRYLNLPF